MVPKCTDTDRQSESKGFAQGVERTFIERKRRSKGSVRLKEVPVVGFGVE